MIQDIIDKKIRNATATIHIFSLTLSTKEQELVQEKQKMDDLLFLTLPLQVFIFSLCFNASIWSNFVEAETCIASQEDTVTCKFNHNLLLRLAGRVYNLGFPVLLVNKTFFPQIAKDIQSKKRIKAINIENVSILFR